MPPRDPNDYQDNGMQRQAGLIPPVGMPPMMTGFPGQTAASVAQYFQTGIPGGGGFPNAFPQPMPTFTTSSPFMPGPSGVMMPMYGAAPSNPFAAMGGRPAMGGGSMYGGGAMGPPPAYAGAQGQAPVLFAPQTPPGFFDTPHQTAMRQQYASDQRLAALSVGAPGIGARMGTNLAAGAAGFAVGGPVGGLLGFAASEMSGLGRGAQNMYMRNFGASQLNTQAYGAALQDTSASFISGGPAGSITGAGFSRPAALQTASMLTEMAGSRDFRTATSNRFNTGDVMRIAQGGAESGLMSGVQSPEQMRDRVRQLAQSLTSFMELAQEPDIRRAIQTMGNMQMQGLNMNETMQAVRNGRTFARAAGMSFNAMAEMGGGMGAQTFQSLGLTQGLGFQTGMQNMGLAGMSQNLRTLSPQMMNLVGGTQGLAGLNTMFSAGMLQMPMVAPGVMSARGGIDVNAMRGLMGGGADVFGLTSRGAGTLGGMARGMGVEGLGMAMAMQPMLQDTMGRILQSQGPFAQRGFEDRSIINTMGHMRHRGSAGFITSAQLMGMGQSQAVARAMEVGDPRFWARQRDQIGQQGVERVRADMRREDAESQTSWLDEATSAFTPVARARQWMSGVGRSLRRFGETLTQGFQRDSAVEFDSRESRQFGREMLRSDDFWSGFNRFQEGGSRRRTFGGQLRYDTALAQQRGLSGVAAGVSGFFSGDREEEGRLFEARGEFARGVLRASPMSAAGQARSERSVFGTEEAARGFQTDLLRTLGDQGNQQGRFLLNTAGRGASIAAGLFTVGGQALSALGAMPSGEIVGRGGFDINAIQESMVTNVMRGRGVGRDAAQTIVRQQMPAILSQARRSVETYGTREDVTRLRQQERLFQEQDDPSIRDVAIRGAGMQRHAAEGLLGITPGTLAGRQGAEVTQGVMALIDRAGSGIGNTSTRRQESRGIIAQLAMLHHRMQGSGPWSTEDRRAASAQYQRISARARQDLGLTREQQMAMEDQSRTMSQHGNIPAEAIAQGENLVRGDVATLVRRGRAAGVEGQRGQLHQDVSTGMGVLAAAGGQLGGIFAGAHGPADVMRRLTEIGNDQDRLATLRREDSTMADAAVQAARGNTTRAQGLMGERAQAAAQSRRAVDRNLGGFGGALGSVLEFIGVQQGAAERNRIASRVSADAQTNRAIGQNVAGEQAAVNAGIGGSGDQLAVAARELRAAARLLSGTAETARMGDLTGDE